LRVRPGLACFGEIGLTGRLRAAGQSERRLAECEKLGLSEALAPEGTPSHGTIRVAAAKSLRQAISVGLDASGPPD
jgi:DNA repair protein RadA/Sms